MTYDVVIAGTGCAGAMCGALLSQKGLHVALVDRAPFPRESSGLGWVGGRAKSLLDEIRASGRRVLHRPINRVMLYNADLTQSAKPRLERAPGHIIEPGAFEGRIIEAAAGAGATLHHECQVSDVLVREDETELKLEGGESLVGRLLVLASGRASQLARRIGFVTPPALGDGFWAASLSASLAKAAPKNKHAATIIMGMSPQGGFGIVLSSGDQLTVSVHIPSSRDEALLRLAQTCKALAGRNLIPSDVEERIDQAVVCPPPPSALEMDSHVGKHALVIGEAGGFVSAVSNETVVPGLWSARIAADVIETALAAHRPQDELMTFDTRWRLEMADYLRMPNTDMQFLVPLVFSNQPMADRITRAFFLGENI